MIHSIPPTPPFHHLLKNQLLHLVGEGDDWGAQLPESGGARDCYLRTRKRLPKENETKHQKMTRDNNSHRKGDRRGHRDTETPMAEDPQGTEKDLGTGRGRQGGENGHRTRQHKQACGAGRRDKRRRLAGGKKIQVEDDPLRERMCEAGER